MTDSEAVDFVDTQIAGRYKNLTDAVRGDWLRAVKYCELGIARGIVRDIVDDPSARLCVKEFIKRRPRQRKPQVEVPHYFPWVRCLEAPPDHPEWQDQEWLRFDSWRPSDSWDKEAVATMASLVAGAIQEQHGGQWCGVVRPDDQRPENHPELWRTEADGWIREHIVNGPDGPGRGVLLGQSEPLPAARALACKVADGLAEKTKSAWGREPKIPTEADLDKLTKKPKAPVPSGPRPINWDDEDLPWEQG